MTHKNASGEMPYKYATKPCITMNHKEWTTGKRSNNSGHILFKDN